MNKTATITFGRYSPPSIGHAKLFDKAYEISLKNNSDFFIYTSHSFDAKKNPLQYPKKIFWLKKIFKKYAKFVVQSNSINVLGVAAELYKKGYKSLILVVGQDRIEEFNILLKKYNNVESKHGKFSFESVKVISAGNRDPDSEGVEGISSSKLRGYAEKNDFSNFSKGIANISDTEKKKLFQDVRKGMMLENKIMSFHEYLKLNEESKRLEID